MAGQESIQKRILARWEEKVIARMASEGKASITFVMGTDFDKNELSWIETRLVPHLRTAKQFHADIYFIGTSPGCDCMCNGNCEHGDGRELRVSLI